MIVSDEGGRVLADSANQALGRTLPEVDRSLRVPLVVDGRTVSFLHYLDSGGGTMGSTISFALPAL